MYKAINGELHRPLLKGLSNSVFILISVHSWPYSTSDSIISNVPLYMTVVVVVVVVVVMLVLVVLVLALVLVVVEVVLVLVLVFV